MLLIAAVSSLVAATPALVENPEEIAYEQECCEPLVLTEEEVLDSQAIVFDTNVELEENSENPEVISDEDSSEKE